MILSRLVTGALIAWLRVTERGPFQKRRGWRCLTRCRSAWSASSARGLPADVPCNLGNRSEDPPVRENSEFYTQFLLKGSMAVCCLPTFPFFFLCWQGRGRASELPRRRFGSGPNVGQGEVVAKSGGEEMAGHSFWLAVQHGNAPKPDTPPRARFPFNMGACFVSGVARRPPTKPVKLSLQNHGAATK